MHRAWMWSLALLLSAAAAQAANVVAYGPATDNEVTYATDAGHTVTVWDETTWQSASAADFAPFDAILVGDGGCGDPTAPSGLFQNAALWGPMVNGNVVMHGHDDHNSPENNYDGLIVNCTDFASAGNGLGLCISIQCVSLQSEVPEGGPIGPFTIPGLGDFELDNLDGDGIEIVLPEHPAMTGLTDADLDCWGSSVHTHIQSFPSAFVVLAADNGLLCEFASPEAGEGEGGTGPVIIARGGLGTIMSIPTLSSVALALLATALAAASILILRRRIRV